MTGERKITEYKNELPPVYKTWLDWYFDLKRWAKKEDIKMPPEMEATYDYMPLIHEHDDSVIHAYHAKVGYIQAQIFREMEELMDALDPQKLDQYYYNAARENRYNSNEGTAAIDSIMKYLIEYSWRNKQIQNK